MSVIAELIRTEQDGTLSFGNFELNSKSKLSDYIYEGDNYKVKTFFEITKLEKNGQFVYESVPGTAVHGFRVTESGVDFMVYGYKDSQITVGLEESTSYHVTVDGVDAGVIKTNVGGKLVVNAELKDGVASIISIEKA